MSISDESPPERPELPDSRTVSRSTFLQAGLAALGAVGATAAALEPLKKVDDYPSFEEFFQKHYKELSKEEMAAVLERTRVRVKKKFGVDATVGDPKPIEGVEFAYALNIGRCVGCRKCVYACMKENNQSREPQVQYIRVLKMKKGSINVESSQHLYEDETVPTKDHYYMPVQCHQCRKAPCVKACPVQATWQEPDGIIAIDYDWCIGCRYCMAACPYGARVFNFAEPKIKPEEINTNMSYLGNRPKKKGVVEKCHFCMQRTRKGQYPACVEVCPTGSRKFGNILDPESEISKILETKRVYILKEEVGTLPRFYYYFDV
ncbi:MAG: 4Fe-4S ferredoxin [Elusimicrobia bacterium CG1_02_63_36]|nr:MAG: 4Fe-4S ferredoxin [Elusimicrobia bacterium CG1_02_63_36]PIP83390.1 MAG: 4Fe-4S ferredoxin [Elusimicrobia bacterium CG22_combo_CG10-13_8_21_14_all_63_91]PJA11648.1 MAG: 4Fe-4S ferredoxin [Elusimicrobia bacterium CG_4_10_14_0_2_um_filter_63_34]PJB23061.1 MAG: 4Fe-4S ferredoxin [Elusimicrobia bacterium CG_4_9_14_3_um_filter_62_55]